jgi:hypothetical protein
MELVKLLRHLLQTGIILDLNTVYVVSLSEGYQFIRYCSVARWPNSGPQDSKMVLYKYWRPRKWPNSKFHNCGLILTIIGQNCIHKFLVDCFR